MGDDLLAALHAAIDDCDEVGWDDARTSDLRPEAVHAAIDAAFASLPDSLDAAWAEAEAALPEGYALSLETRGPWYTARAEGGRDEPAYTASADTLVIALRALAARLRDRG
jgi:hypothetical protein